MHWSLSEQITFETKTLYAFQSHMFIFCHFHTHCSFVVINDLFLHMQIARTKEGTCNEDHQPLDKCIGLCIFLTQCTRKIVGMEIFD